MNVRWPLALMAVLLACEAARPKVFDCAAENCEDCAVLAERTAQSGGNALTLQTCRTCQGASCVSGADGGLPIECLEFPCVDGGILVRGCNRDEDCPGPTRGAATLCGAKTATHNVCVTSDAI